MLELVSKGLLALVIVVLYYFVIRLIILRNANFVVRYFRLGRRHPVADVSNVVELALTASFHVIFCGFLLFLTGHTVANLLHGAFDPVLVFYGILLGVAEQSVASLLCRIVISGSMLIAPSRVPAELKDWLVVARSGWIRRHLRTAEIAPWPLVALIITLQVSAEEIVFRVVLLNYLLPCGAAWALTGSVALFTLIQIGDMPSWYSAMFPVVGAFVMGIVHGAIYLAVPCIVPLIVAHIVFFVFAVL